MFRNAASTKPWQKRCQANDLSQDPSLSTARGWVVFEIWKRFPEELLMPALHACILYCCFNETVTKTLLSRRFITRRLPLDCSRTNGLWDLTTVSGSIFHAGSICLFLVMLVQPNRNKNVINPTIYHKTPPFQLLADEWFLRSENGFRKNSFCLLYLLVFCIAVSTKAWLGFGDAQITIQFCHVGQRADPVLP